MNPLDRQAILLRIRQTLYYWIIFIVSIVVLVFMPMIGSEAGIGFNLPTSPAGWAIYITTKVLVAVLNVVIFFSFMQQAKLNVRDNENYKKACAIVSVKRKDLSYKYKPRNPKAWEAKQYASKGFTIFLSTAVSLVALSNAFLTYDYFSLLTYGMTILLGIVFGLIQMASAEDYWTREFYDYAVGLLNDQETTIYTEEEQKTIVGQILSPKGENNGNN